MNDLTLLREKALLLIKQERTLTSMRLGYERATRWMLAMKDLAGEVAAERRVADTYEPWTRCMVQGLHFQKAICAALTPDGLEVLASTGRADDARRYPLASLGPLGERAFGWCDETTAAAFAAVAPAIGFGKLIYYRLDGRTPHVLLVAGYDARVSAHYDAFDGEDLVYFERLAQHFDALSGNVALLEALGQQAEWLDARQREIRALNADLETRVEQRTAELSLANQQLAAANGARGEFLANMSHEIRTPMTSVLGYADLLLDPELSAAERLAYVQTIRRNGEHLLSILNDILDISKIDAGKMTVERVAFAPAHLLADVTSLMRLRAVDKGLAFDVRYETPIPERIEGDPTRLRQILLNLIGNAIKFTSAGSVRLSIRCRATSQGTALAFEVADSGIGLSRSQVEKLFQPFVQADASTTRRFGGTGLGLVICQRLAAMMGGRIEVESAPGRGSSFTLTLDVTCPVGVAMIASLDEARADAHDTSPLPAAVTLDGSVLLAEDGPDNRVLIATQLRKAGARVTIAENGRVAVDSALAAAASGEPFGVILMDMQMPELDGYGATAALRAAAYGGAIVALTANAMAGDRERCLLAGCDDFLTKPIQRSLLFAVVQRYLSPADRASPGPPGRDGPGFTAPAPCLIRAPFPSAEPEAPLRSTFADDPDMVELIDDFVAALPALSRGFAAALSEGKRDALQSLAHKLKGAAGGYGFAVITEAAARLERAVVAGVPAPALSGATEELRSLCHRATSASGCSP